MIEEYLQVISPFADEARDVAIAKLRSYLQQATPADFDSAEDFAAKLFDQIKVAYDGTFASSAAAKAVKQATKAIYTFYRLRDETVFGAEGSPVKLSFGAPDRRAIRFFDDLDHFYFSKYVDNSRAEIKNFLKQEYLEKGAALFGRETPESLDDFRKAAAGKLDNINDRGVKLIVQNGVQRIRNYAHINSLRQARIKVATIVAILDQRTSHICRTLDGKKIRIGVAAETVDRLTELEPGDYAQEMFQTAEAKAMRVANSDPEAAEKYFESKVTDGYVNDDIIESGLGLPPYHPNCRTRLEGVVEF